MGALVGSGGRSAVVAGVPGVRLALGDPAGAGRVVVAGVPGVRLALGHRPEPVASSLPVCRACVSPSATRPRASDSWLCWVELVELVTAGAAGAVPGLAAWATPTPIPPSTTAAPAATTSVLMFRISLSSCAIRC